MARKYSQTELWMMWGLIFGAAIGSLVLAFTGDVLWLGPLAGIGLVVGVSIGQLRDRQRGAKH